MNSTGASWQDMFLRLFYFAHFYVSMSQINLDFYTRDTIAQNLQLPAAVCFVEAQRKVYSLMENDVYPRFLQSDCYRDLCVAASGALGLGNHSRA